MTIAVPKASDSGTLRRGVRTSPGVNVMLFHASAENSEPVWATHKATSRPNEVSGVNPEAMGLNPRGVHKSPKFPATAARFHPKKMPSPISPNNEQIYATVETFCTRLPYSIPSVFE